MSAEFRRAILDIGSNAGDFGIEAARRNPEHLVVCVEPIPMLAAAIAERARANGLDNVVVEECALASDPSDNAVLNVAGQGDLGISSLLPLDVDSIRADEYWSAREDLKYTEEIAVRVKTLRAILEERQIDIVDFVKIDVQGLDLDVLRSAGDRIGSIRAGMLEVPTVRSVGLYVGENQDLAGAYVALPEMGFEVAGIKPNDEATNEVNVYFVRVGSDLRGVEDELSLRGLDLYDGKHFWAIPCHSLEAMATARARFYSVEGLESEGAELRAQLDGLESTVATLRAHASAIDDERRVELGREMAARRSVSAELDQSRLAVVSLTRQLETLGSRLVKSNTARERLIADVRAAEELSRAFETEAQGARAALAEVLGSTSWRVSLPVRWFGSVVRRRR